MPRKSKLRTTLLMGICFVVASAYLQVCAAQDVVHAVDGTVKKVDKTAKTVAVDTADGTEHVFTYTAHTTVETFDDGGKLVKKGAGESALGVKDGAHVVVHYTEKGADKTAVAVRDFGKADAHFVKGTVVKMDKATRTLTLKGEDGVVKTYHVSKDATVDTEHGVVKATEYAGKEGEHVTVHYTKIGADDVVHFVKRI
ncbi:MAG TPA: hypothetical protein VK473_05460 [Terriglobales bacterium]|nr:hypothetical protein [Terriglobales bacterium]